MNSHFFFDPHELSLVLIKIVFSLSIEINVLIKNYKIN